MRRPAPQPRKGVHMQMPKRPRPHSARQLLRPLSATSAQQLLQQWQLSSMQQAEQATYRCRLELLTIIACFQRCLLDPAPPILGCSDVDCGSHLQALQALSNRCCLAGCSWSETLRNIIGYVCCYPNLTLVFKQYRSNLAMSSSWTLSLWPSCDS